MMGAANKSIACADSGAFAASILARWERGAGYGLFSLEFLEEGEQEGSRPGIVNFNVAVHMAFPTLRGGIVPAAEREREPESRAKDGRPLSARPEGPDPVRLYVELTRLNERLKETEDRSETYIRWLESQRDHSRESLREREQSVIRERRESRERRNVFSKSIQTALRGEKAETWLRETLTIGPRMQEGFGRPLRPANRIADMLRESLPAAQSPGPTTPAAVMAQSGQPVWTAPRQENWEPVWRNADEAENTTTAPVPAETRASARREDIAKEAKAPERAEAREAQRAEAEAARKEREFSRRLAEFAERAEARIAAENPPPAAAKPGPLPAPRAGEAGQTPQGTRQPGISSAPSQEPPQQRSAAAAIPGGRGSGQRFVQGLDVTRVERENTFFEGTDTVNQSPAPPAPAGERGRSADREAGAEANGPVRAETAAEAAVLSAPGDAPASASMIVPAQSRYERLELTYAEAGEEAGPAAGPGPDRETQPPTEQGPAPQGTPAAELPGRSPNLTYPDRGGSYANATVDPAYREAVTQETMGRSVDLTNIAQWDTYTETAVDPTFRETAQEHAAGRSVDLTNIAQWDTYTETAVDPTFRETAQEHAAGRSVDLTNIAQWDSHMDTTVNPIYRETAQEESAGRSVDLTSIAQWDSHTDTTVNPVYRETAQEEIAGRSVDLTSIAHWDTHTDTTVNPVYRETVQEHAASRSVDLTSIAQWDTHTDTTVNPVYRETAQEHAAGRSVDLTNITQWDIHSDTTVNPVYRETAQEEIAGRSVNLTNIAEGDAYTNTLLPPEGRERPVGERSIVNDMTTVLPGNDLMGVPITPVMRDAMEAGAEIVYHDVDTGRDTVALPQWADRFFAELAAAEAAAAPTRSEAPVAGNGNMPRWVEAFIAEYAARGKGEPEALKNQLMTLYNALAAEGTGGASPTEILPGMNGAEITERYLNMANTANAYTNLSVQPPASMGTVAPMETVENRFFEMARTLARLDPSTEYVWNGPRPAGTAEGPRSNLRPVDMEFKGGGEAREGVPGRREVNTNITVSERPASRDGFTPAELDSMANRIYAKIENRLKLEKRRLGL